MTGTTTSNDIGYTDVGVLPNITGYISAHVRTKFNGSTTGAFYIDSVGTNYSGDYREGGQGNLGFDASLSSNIYNSDYQEVQPKRILMYFIIKYI